MRDLEIRDLSLIVRDVFGLPDDADSRVVERLKHMRKLAFPSAIRVGQGHRQTYGAEDALKVTVAFQLLDAGLASTLAVSLVDAHWPAIAEALCRAGGRASSRIQLKPNVIGELSKGVAGRSSAARPQAARAVQPVASDTGQQLEERRRTIPSAVIVLDLAELVRSLNSAFRRVEGVATDEVASAVARIGRT
jgi:hypothetical protein